MALPAGHTSSYSRCVFISTIVCGDGQSNWFKGVQLVTVYIIIATMFYFLPELTVKDADTGPGKRFPRPICWSATNNEAALKARRWPQRTNLWRKRTNLRMGSERLSDISLKVICEKQRTSTFSHHRRVKRLS